VALAADTNAAAARRLWPERAAGGDFVSNRSFPLFINSFPVPFSFVQVVQQLRQHPGWQQIDTATHTIAAASTATAPAVDGGKPVNGKLGAG
jgi:hypothetical protein